MILGYARVSTDGADQDISIAEQVRQLKGAGCDRVIAERRSAFKDAPRPGWDELLGMVAAGHVRKVVAVSLSRLSRRGEDVPFLRLCARRGVEVQLLDGTPADAGDPAGKLLTGVLSLVNEVDSEIKSLNIKNGLKRRKAEGHYACGRVPFGYAYDGSQVVPHPVHFAEARQIWEWLKAEEWNFPATVRKHDLRMGPQGLGRWINNPILRGVVRGQPNKVEAVIPWREWQQARRVLEARTSNRTRAPRVRRPFSGQVRCDGCVYHLHYIHAFGKPRLKCSNIRCRYYGRGLAEWKVRAQFIEELRATAVDRLAAIAAAPPPEPALLPGDEEKMQQVAQLEALQAQGVPGLEPTIEAMRLELLAPPAPLASADWTGCRELLLTPGVLEGATDEELRALVLEFASELRYVGDCNQIVITLRDGPGEDPA